MLIHNAKRTPLVTLVIVILILSACATHSIEENRQFEDINAARSVTVVLFPMYWETNTTLRDDDILKDGCTYTTQNPKLIANLVNDLRTAVTRSYLQEEWYQEPREMIHLTLASGEEVRFHFGRTLSGENEVRGIFVRGGTKTNVSAKLPFPETLYKWAAQSGNPMWSTPDGRESCKYFREYKFK